MVLADSSAWIEFLRATESSLDKRLEELLSVEEPLLATTGQVVMEVLVGSRDEAHRRKLKSLLARAASFPARDPDDFEQAAAIRRATLAAGADAPAGDCLIAAVAQRAGLSVLHRDRHFDAIAAVTRLELVALD